MEPTPIGEPDDYAKNVDEEQLEAQLDDEEGINDDHDVTEEELWEEGGEEEVAGPIVEAPLSLTTTLPKSKPGVPGEAEEVEEEPEEEVGEEEEEEILAPVIPAPVPTETKRAPKLPTVKTTPVSLMPTAKPPPTRAVTAPRVPTVPPTVQPTVPLTAITKPAPPLPGYAPIPAKPKAKAKAKGPPVYVEPEVDLEELLVPDPMEDPDSFRFREKYTYALTALPSPWSDLKASSKVALGYMAVKKARYGIKYEPSVEALLTKINEALGPLFAMS